jgi:hypothetical protein
MKSNLSERAADYIQAKAAFCERLRVLHGYMMTAGFDADSMPVMESVELFLSLGTEEFIKDPQSHFPGGHLQRYQWVMSGDRYLEGWERMGLLPSGFAIKALHEFTLMCRNSIRVLHPELRDEQIWYGRYLQFPPS